MPTLSQILERCLKFMIGIVVLIMLPSAMRLAQAEGAQVEVKEVYEVQLSEFTERFTFPEVKSFDLSPDGKTLAVEFYVGDRGKSVGIWIVLWDVDAGRMVSSKRLEVRSRRDIGYLPRFGFGIRFSYDEKMFLVLTGPQLVGLSFPDLEIQYTIEPLRGHRREMFITHFAMASQARRIAVVHHALRKGPAIHDARILNVDTGETIQGWRSKGRGVGPMALTCPPQTGPVLMLELDLE